MAEQDLREDNADSDAAQAAPKRPIWQRILVGVGITVAVIALAALVLLKFGGMGGSAYDPEIRQAYRDLVASQQVAAVERRFVIPIPGCTCHSRDPYRTEEHRNRRLSECMGCHG